MAAFTAPACEGRAADAIPARLEAAIPTSGDSIPQPRIAHEIVRLPVVEGQRLRFRRISTADGLSQTRVAQIVQDDRGFIWFGTQYGLNRYDGYEFKLFVHDPRRTDSLSGSFIAALFKDRSGALWIGCSQILDRLDPQTETFTHYRIDSGDHEGLGATVVHISQDRNGTLWLASGTGLHNLDPVTGKIAHYQLDAKHPDGLSTNNVLWTGEDRTGRFWVGTSNGLDEFDRVTGKVKYHIPIPEGTRLSFFEDRQGFFWIAYASGNGLALLDRRSNILTRYSFYKDDPPPTALTGVMGILEDRNGDLLLGSPGIGLLRLDRQRNVFVHYGHRPEDPESIAEDKVIVLFEDHDRNMWAGLHAKGPNVFARSRTQFETFRHEIGNPNSLSVDFVNAIYEDPAGSLWVGNDDGLNRIDRVTGKRTSWSGGLGAKPMVITITQDPSGLIWFGTFGHGLNSFQPKTGRFKSYLHNPSDPRSLSNDEVHRLLIDRSGTLWVATDDGLDRFDSRTDNFTVYKVDWSNRYSQSYVDIAQDAGGKLWLGTHYSGLHYYDPATGQFLVYKSDPMNLSWLRDNTIPTVHIDRAGAIWVGTQNGLNKLDPATGQMTAYDVHDGLPANAVSCILEDGRGNLWMSTTNGLSRFNPTTGAFVNYSVVDGLPGNDLTGWSSCFESSRGEMFFGGFPGAVAFFPDQLDDSHLLPPVVLTDFQLSGVSMPIGPDSPLIRSIVYTDRITLTHDQRAFSVTFAGLNYLSPGATRYRYRLDGLDQQWTEVAGDRRRVTYTTLPAGLYTLRVQAGSTHGPWNEQGASLAIEVMPPRWNTWWFRTAYCLLILLTVWYLYRLRMRQVSRQLTIRMEERLDERTRIAQELHDTLLQGLLSASLQLELGNSQIASDAPAKPLVARVLELLRQMIDEGRNAVQGLRAGQSETDDLGSAFTQISKDLVAVSKVKYRLIVEGTPRPLRPLIRDEVYRIGGEALGNAFRHSGASAVETVLEYGRDRFRLVVRDDGQGIDPGVLDSGREGHWGLSGIRERSARIGAKLAVRSAAGAGTEIDLIVPAVTAFEGSARGGPMEWLSRLYSRSDRE